VIRPRHRGRVVRGLIATAALLAVTVAPGFAEAKRAEVDVALKTRSQANLVASGKVKLRARSAVRRTAVLSVRAHQAGEKRRVTERRQTTLSPRHNRRIALRLTERGMGAAQSCIPTKLEVVAKTKRGRVLDRAKARLRRDANLCDGNTPVGVDLSAADRCDFIMPPGEECLFPYPNDYFTRADPSTDTGLRLNLQPASTPANASGKHIDPRDINTSDGFSPGALIVLHVPGMDAQDAFARTGAVPITRMGDYADADQPIVLIDADTGRRHPVWAELDANAATPGDTDLLIHPTRNLADGHRYIVALRKLRDAGGKKLPAPAGFRLYRDRIPTNIDVVEARRAHFNQLFSKLEAAGIKRRGLYLAWDFTVASTRNLSERMLSIRDDALALLGDTTPGDGVPQGTAPAFTITNVTNYSFPAPEPSGRGVQDVRTVEGTYTVPCYLDQPGCPSGSRFDLGPNGLPQRLPGNTMQARFGCNIPRSAVEDGGGGTPVVDVAARPSMYGHGLFGEYDEVFAENVRQLGDENNVITCATDWIGMADEDILPEALPALLDLSNFEPLPDRLQQGFLNFVYLGRLLNRPDGFASDPAFRFGGQPAIDTSRVYYYGNSQGGIAGGALTAIEPDVTRSVLYVPGMNYGGLLLTRSVDFEEYAQVLYPTYRDEGERPLLLSMIQSMWDRGEPNGYANHMTSDPLPGTPEHRVMLAEAYGDHQVANIATETEARTIGAPLRQPALDAARLPAGFEQPFFDLPALGDLSGPAADGNALFVWDIGPKRDQAGTIFGTDPPPISNTAPNDSFGVDPHDTVIEESPLIRAQIASFLRPNGKVTDPCGPTPCYAAGWMGMP
jgi:hypothetical protein